MSTKSRNIQTMAVLLILAATAPAGAQVPASGVLGKHDCSVIDAYGSRLGLPSLLDQFEAMALMAEWCTAAGGPCVLPYLRRWDDPFVLTVALGKDVKADSEAAIAALNGVDVGLTFVAQARGVPMAEIVRFGEAAKPGVPTVRVAVASRAELQNLSREWSTTMPGLDLEGAAKVGLSQDVACWAVASDAVPAPGRLVGGFVFLDAALPSETLLHCGKEEAMNLFIDGDPIGDASLFDDPWGRAAADPVLGMQFSSRDEVLIRLLYHRNLVPGQVTDKARAAAAGAISASCG